MNNYDIKCKIIEEELKTFWPQWHVVKHLGGGAFGDVFEVYRDNFGIRESSALKMIQISDAEEIRALFSFTQEAGDLPKRGGQPDIPSAFRNEIQIMEALRGAPNIVTIEDFHLKRDASSTTLFVRMELLTSFQQVTAERQRNRTPFTIPEILKIGRDICTALMYCEGKGIIHRDIKPANLFMDGFGNYKVGDFGASKHLDTVHAAKTMTGIGTISYMAPEIFRGHSYNNTVDIYAVGLVLYQLLNNGRIPFLPAEGAFTTKDIDSANYRRLHGTPLPSLAGRSVGGRHISSRLDAVVRKACAMDPTDRYQTAKEFYDALTLPEAAEKKNTSAYVKRPQESGVPTEPSRRTQQETGRSDPDAGAPVVPPADRPVSSRLKKEKRNLLIKKPLLIIGFLLIAAVAALVVLKSRGGSSIPAYEEEKGGVSTENDKAQESTTPVERSAEIVEIPDPVLKKAIQDTLGIGDREITESDALSLTHLEYAGVGYELIGVEKDKIKDITGLEAFKNLTELDLSDNQISDISALSGLTSLTDLYLNDNEIDDISTLSGLTHLETLWLNGNPVLEKNSKEEILEILSGADHLKIVN